MQAHALVQTKPGGLSRPDLEHVPRSTAAGHPPRRQSVHDPDDLQIAVAEDDVERRPHEEHVDRFLAEGEALPCW